MSKPLKNVLEPSNEADAQHDVAVAAAVVLAMDFYGRDTVTAAAKRAFEARTSKAIAGAGFISSNP